MIGGNLNCLWRRPSVKRWNSSTISSTSLTMRICWPYSVIFVVNLLVANLLEAAILKR